MNSSQPSRAHLLAGVVVALSWSLADCQTKKSFKYFYFQPVTVNSNMVQLAELNIANNGYPIAWGNYGCSAENPGGDNPSGEGPNNAIDGNPNTKWLDRNKLPLKIVCGTGIQMDQFAYTTANDSPERDPVRFLFMASQDGIGYDNVLDRTYHDSYVPVTNSRHALVGWFSLVLIYVPSPAPTPLPTPAPTPLPTPKPTPKPQSNFFLKEGTCKIIDDNGYGCVTNPEYPKEYGQEQICRFNATGTLKLIEFATEKWFDIVKIDGQEYSGNVSGTVTATSELLWSSDFWIEGPGWKICAIPPRSEI